MLYNPKHFHPASQDAAFRLIEEYPFATVIAHSPENNFVAHLPIVVEPNSGSRNPQRLLAHVAKPNRQWQVFAEDPTALIIFHGPDHYISPTWYAEHDVPTWNYAVVHVQGRVRIVQDSSGIERILSIMTDKFESGPNGWKFALPADLNSAESLAAAIVGLEIEIIKIEAKFKLGQNRSAADRSGIKTELSQRGDERGLRMLDLMEQNGV
jgi:transcriptional regulator